MNLENQLEKLRPCQRKHMWNFHINGQS